MNTKVIFADGENFEEEISEAAELIKKGEVVAFPTETVYGLGANALDSEAVRKIFEAKGRPADNPLIVHIADEKDLESLVEEVPEVARKLMREFWPGPLTLIFRKSEEVPLITSGGLDTVAVRIPSSEIARSLIKQAGVPIAAPSANISGKPSATSGFHVLTDFDGKIACVIDAGPTQIGLESTVLDVTEEVPVLLRPGGVPLEEIERVVGKIKTRAEVGQEARSPGMRHKHYSPRAKIILIEGKSQARVHEEIEKRFSELKRNGFSVGILSLSDEFVSLTEDALHMGESEEEIARRLFEHLRAFDSEDFDFLLVEGISEEGLGRAVMDRLRRAASEVIVC